MLWKDCVHFSVMFFAIIVIQTVITALTGWGNAGVEYAAIVAGTWTILGAIREQLES